MSAAAMESNRNLTSDEDYLVNCAINKETVDSYAAKAWLLTAKTMFPKSFRIQFEEYNIHKKANNCKAAADCVVEMYREFINYNDLWVEIKNIWTSINSDAQDEESKILSEIFQNIPKDTQQLILLSAAEHSKDSFEQCTIIFLVLKLFPRCIRKHGIPLIDMFLSAENCLQPYNPLNIYRSMLVCEVLPMLLKSSHISMSPDQLYQLLLKGIEYYVVSAVGGKSENFHSESQDPSIIWKNMFTLFDIVGKKLNWELHDIFAPRNFTESQWQRIQNLFILYNECQDKSRNVMLHSQLLFSSLILFVHCLYGYSVTCNPDYFPVSKPVINTQLILVEDVKSCADPKLFNSKDLLEQPSILVSSSKSDLISSTLTHNFTVAVKCYDLLHSETFLQEFHQIQMTLKMELWPWYYSFHTDALIYQEKYTMALSTLNKISMIQNYSNPENKSNLIKMSLQIASCLLHTGNYKSCCEHIIKVVSYLPNMESNDSVENANPLTSLNSGRNIRILCLSKEEILGICVSIMISSLQASLRKNTKDLIIGHLLVLLQYDWPKREDEFIHILDTIRQQGSFSYNIFFNYIINVDILEEFAYLGNSANRNYINLNILSSNTQLAKQRTITRGVNKEVKEDFRQSLEKQVSTVQDSIQSVILSFLTNESETLLSCFTN